MNKQRRKYRKWPNEPFNLNRNAWCYYTPKGMYFVVRHINAEGNYFGTSAVNVPWKKMQAMTNRYRRICRDAHA